MITLTLAQIKKHEPCEDGWRKLLKSLGGIDSYGKDTPVTFEQIINSNGLDDALWALRCLGAEHQGWIRHYAVDCAESFKHLMEDERSLKVLEVERRHADGEATDEELAAARSAAWDAARDVAEDAARSAAWAAAMDAAWDAARAATKSAARSAAWDAARSAAWAATKSAAWAATKSAARSAAWDAARAAFAELLIEYTRTGKRVMNAQEIIKKHTEKALEDK